MQNNEKGVLGEKFVTRDLEKKGYKVSRRGRGDKGFDLLAQKGAKKLKIEVKTTGNLNGGIPDMHNTEFKNKNGKWYFVPDLLYIVRINKDFKPVQLDILTKREIDRYADSHKTVIRVRTTKLDKDLFKKKVGKSRINF
jgi:hypothetical protein